MRNLQAARGAPIADLPAAEAAAAAKAPRRWRGVFLAVAVAGAGLDVFTKVLAVRLLETNQVVPLVGGLLQLRLIRNPGAAFSMGERYTFVFAILALLVLGFVLIRLVPTIRHPGWAVALGFLCAGVAGNLVDRIFRWPGFLRGHVVDFLQLPYWPIFNVADICISTAAVMIVVLSMVKGVGLDGRRDRGDTTAA